ncbi:MAG: hypothetical protein A3F72_01900 [Bacteroidetes bacterium RIFCSPLOWO2_12_FULL_35_15]|nr:MAG: hypothetical protein A3F72_01900 [Bacteroidetes bacterium RIFCSPLOWO2_12_FULL_35_15]
MANKTSTAIISVINSGTNVIVDGNGYTSTALVSMANAARAKNVMLTIKNTTKFTSTALVSIGNAGKTHVTIEV